MQPTQADLQIAFMRSSLPTLGYTFQTAMEYQALRTCVVRLATLATKAKPLPSPKKVIKPMWYHNI